MNAVIMNRAGPELIRNVFQDHFVASMLHKDRSLALPLRRPQTRQYGEVTSVRRPERIPSCRSIAIQSYLMMMMMHSRHAPSTRRAHIRHVLTHASRYATREMLLVRSQLELL